MNKAEMMRCVSGTTGLSRGDAARAIDALVVIIREEVAAGNEVVVPGLGKFTLVERAPCTGRNPRTGEGIEIGARKVPKFKPSADFLRMFGEDEGE
jgi:DNA-binding protein HU-beta